MLGEREKVNKRSIMENRRYKVCADINTVSHLSSAQQWSEMCLVDEGNWIIFEDDEKEEEDENQN
jgi:hypothetical protein